MTKQWASKPFGAVCELRKGKIPALTATLKPGLAPYLSVKYLRGEAMPQFAPLDDRNSVQVGIRDVLIICDGSNSGETFTGFEGVLASTMAKVVHPESIDARYLRYYLSSLFEKFNDRTTGAAIPHLDLSALRREHLPLPPLKEQRRIATILEEACDDIALATMNAHKNVANARELFLSERSSLFRPQPGWGETTVDRLATNLDSRRVPVTKDARRAGPYPYYGASGIVDHVSSYIFDGDALLVSEDGANLLTRATPIAFAVSGRFWVNNHAHVLKFKSRVTQTYVQHYLESIRLDRFVTGAAQPKLTQGALNSIPIPLPQSTAEQRRVVKRIDVLASACTDLNELYRKKTQALEELQRSLIQYAFTGEL